MNWWLMKSEPHAYSWDDLVEDQWTHWDGVRNYQARNMMRDQMKIGDYVLYYHSNCSPPHIAGIARIIKESYPDFTAYDSNSKYFDIRSSPESPRWFMVDIEPVAPLKNIVTLPVMRSEPLLEGMLLLRKGQRLSIQPVDYEHVQVICQMGGFQLPLIFE